MWAPGAALAAALAAAGAAACDPRHAAGAPVRVEVGLRNHNIDAIRRRAQQASDPLSPLFGRFLSFDDAARLAHRPASLAAVAEYVRARRPAADPAALSVSGDRQWVRFATRSPCLAGMLRRELRRH
eukprot:gene7405-4963_t